MPGPGVQHAKTGNQVCHCHCEAETLPSPAYNKDISPKKQLICSSRKDEGLSNKRMIDHNGGIAMPLPDVVSHGVANKWPLNHWWEAPTGFGSRGRAASSMLSMEDQLDSPTHSDLTFECGTVSNLHRDDASETAPVNSATFSKASISGAAERVCDPSNDQGPNTSISSRMDSPTSVRGSPAEIESLTIHHEAGHPKERVSRWTDEDGKMVIQSNVFDAILPSADEVGLQWRISELRVALRASESARLESELETEALRKYLAEVEAAAAGLQSRVQELEHLITFSAKDESRELEQLRTKIVMEVSKEARSQTTRAAKAVAAAREATMELDKVKRHASSLIKAQEEEAERLRMEVAECRTLYHARAGQLQGMKDQIEKLEQNLKISSNATTEALKVSQEEVLALQKCLEAAKIEGQDITKQFADLLEAFETQTKAMQSAENSLKELEREKTELASHSEWLEQQLAGLQSQGVAATAVDYDHELRKVRAMLGAEKQHLLTELTMLRHGNQNLQVELIEWQEKFHTLSQQVSAPMALPTPTKGMDSMTIGGPLVEMQSKGESHEEGLDNCENAECTMEGKGVNGQECMTPTMKDTMRPSYLYSCQKSRTKHNASSFDGHYSSHSKEVGRKVCGLQEQRARGNTHQTSCNLLKDDLLAAAHREIVKLKEINQCLMDARHGRMWYGNSHPEKENFSQI